METYGYKTHTVGVGDSIQKIAVMYGVPDWREIVYLNNLKYPYIDDNINTARDVPNYYDERKEIRKIDLSGIAKVGDELLIPSFDYATQPEFSQVDQQKELENLAYGSDLDIYGYNDQNEFVMNMSIKGELSDNNKGDLRIAAGVRNLRQQLLIELSTPLGSLLLHPEFGSTIRDMNGMKATKQTLIKIQLEVQRVIMNNFRVKEIRDLTVTKDGTAIRVKCDIVPVSPYSVFEFDETIE